MRHLWLLVLLVLLLAACAGAPTPTSAPAPTDAPPATPAGPTPSINVKPGAGGPGTQIAIMAAGFPPDAHVSIFLAGGDGVRRPDVFGEALVGEDGRVGLLFILPDAWADGSKIAGGMLRVTLETDDGAQTAAGEFAYTP